MDIIESFKNKFKSHLLSTFRKPFANLEQKVSEVNSYKESFSKKTDEELKALALSFKVRVQNGEDLETVAPEYFALVREASKRIIGLFHYDEQVQAGFILAQRSVAEIGTGEGKTLIANLPASLHALKGEGVHVCTVNSYLSERDYKLLKPLYEFLGLTAGHISAQDSPEEKNSAYSKDITYGTGYQFGFDYLREQLRLLHLGQEKPGESYRKELLGQNKPKGSEFIHKIAGMAIIDEVDSVLLDEGHMPLIIASNADTPSSHPHIYTQARDLALSLKPTDYEFDSKSLSILLTEKGEEKVYKAAISLNLDALKRPFHLYIEAALRAEFVLRKDIHYVLRDNKVIIVDENTGRSFAERAWRSGVHQAVQAKENVPITEESESLANISRQKYFNLYPLACGMTGTAQENKDEFKECFDLEFFKVPLHKPSKQMIYPTRIFNAWDNLLEAIIKEITRIHPTGRPILLGTRTITVSEKIAQKLKSLQISFNLLNAKQDKHEAEIIAQAGEKGAITIATNMAGRGTHIEIDSEVEKLGGLHVMGIEFNESGRINRQLAGRSARQGKAGSVQFFVSADDYIITRYAPKDALMLKNTTSNINGELDSKYVSLFLKVQHKIENDQYYRRKQLIAHDKWFDSIKEKL